MRIMVLAHPKFPIPPEQMPAIMQGFADWRARHRERMEAFEFFAGGGGGFGIVNVRDEATLNQMMLEWPLLPFSELEIRPVISGDTALQQWQQAAQSWTQR
ncbi:MAG: hypothetical protein HY331_17255 [Chloroflexi bacterium]|nr:hypothetical protein [Chloroflexota bacterium]